MSQEEPKFSSSSSSAIEVKPPTTAKASSKNPSSSSYHQLASSSDRTKEGKNAVDLLCTRCSSTVVRAEVADWMEEGEGKERELPHFIKKKANNAKEGEQKERVGKWWRVHNLMDFDNVAFSRPVPVEEEEEEEEQNGNEQQSQEGKNKVKVLRRYLACAECELGPLGLAEETISEEGGGHPVMLHLLAPSRMATAPPASP